MPAQEANDTLTRVGRGTPMGELFRRFWLPALLSSELTADGAPVRLRILGEDLIAFRDTTGRIGILDAYCSHRRAPLFFGRNEASGLRCVYHGWKFDADGRCVDLPNVADPKQVDAMKKVARLTAYRTREAGGLAWIHMGSADRVPAFPRFEWTEVPAGHTHVSRWLQRSNWLQGMEGEIDTSHIGFLHQYFKAPAEFLAAEALQQDRSPVITLRETDYGFTYGARRNYNNEFYWRVTQWLLPMYSAIPRAADGPFTSGGRAWVPVDDQHTTSFSYRYRVDRPHTAAEVAEIESGFFFPPRVERTAVEMPHGYRIDTWLPTARKDNDYLIDRAMQKDVNFAGIWGVNEQDRALQESMPSADAASRGIIDRSREHLVSADLPIAAARRRLLALARALADGIEPALASNGDAYQVRAVAKVCAVADFDEFRTRYAEEEKVPSMRSAEAKR